MKDYTNYIWIFGSLVDIGPKFEPLRPTTLQFHCNSRELRELWKLETPLNCWPTYKKRNHHSTPRQECPKPDSVVLYSNSTKSITTYLTCVMHESIEQMLQQIKQLFLTLTQTKPDRVVFFFFFWKKQIMLGWIPNLSPKSLYLFTWTFIFWSSIDLKIQLHHHPQKEGTLYGNVSFTFRCI